MRRFAFSYRRIVAHVVTATATIPSAAIAAHDDGSFAAITGAMAKPTTKSVHETIFTP